MCCVLEIIHRIRCFPLLFISFVNITSSHFVVFAGSILIPTHVYHFVPSQSLLYYLLLFIRWFVEFDEIGRRSHADARWINGMNGRHLIDCSIDWKLERNVETQTNKQRVRCMADRRNGFTQKQIEEIIGEKTTRNPIFFVSCQTCYWHTSATLHNCNCRKTRYLW